MAQLKGIDISRWQAGLKLANTDAQFAIVKATQGASWVDPECNQFVTQAKNKGIPYGVYHFAERGGTAEADHFVDSIRGYIGHALLALDWEADALQYGVSAAKAFLDRVYARTGVRPVIYTSGSVVTTQPQAWSSVAKEYGLWIARWGSSPGSTGAWKTWTLWQYTDRHQTGGMAVDGDYFNGDPNTWKAYATGTGKHTDDDEDTQPTPAPKPDTGGDDDMALTHVVRSRSTNQNLANTNDWQTVRVREDGDAPVHQLILGPADIINGTVYLHATGLGSNGKIEARVYVVDDPDASGKPDERVRSGSVVTMWALKGGVHGVLPFQWKLSGSGKAGVKRRLQLEVRADSDAAVIEGVRTEMWIRD